MYLSKRLKNFDLSKFCVENIDHYLKKKYLLRMHV